MELIQINFADGDIPLAFWKYDDQIFLEQISIRDNIIYSNIIAMPMKGDEKPDQLETEKLFVEMQLIKKGFDCAPNVKTILSRNNIFHVATLEVTCITIIINCH